MRMTTVLRDLKKERQVMRRDLDAVEHAIKVLSGTREPRGKFHVSRTMSAAGRARISRAQKARWAKVRASK